jgi:glutaminase
LSPATDYARVLQEIAAEIAPLAEAGKVADYIPELANVPPDRFGICLQFCDGRTYAHGHAATRFSIQSIAKVFLLTLAYAHRGEAIWERVGVEPSGNSFNSLVQLEYENGIPRNPFINAGAMVVADILLDVFTDPRQAVLDFVRAMSGTPDIQVNSRVAASERSVGYRNFALANFLKSYGNLHHPVDRVLDLYFCICSIEMSCCELAAAMQFYTRHGYGPYDRDYIQKRQIKRINAIMQTCGFYDEAGEFAFEVGLPGKSGVGGGIVAIHPGSFSVATWSPRLNDKGNSVLGLAALERLTTRLGVSIF